MSLFLNAIKSSVSIRRIKPSQGFSSLLRESPKHFSTETGAPPPPPPQPPSANDASNDPFVRNGMVYGRLSGVAKHTLKSDIINLLEGCNLTPNDVKVNYNRDYIPFAMTVQFPSFKDYDNAHVLIGKKGRLYKLERVQYIDWDIVMPYNGTTILLQNIPRNALTEDIDRFLSGSGYEASSVTLFGRARLPDSIRWATVRFPSQTLAMNAFITKNRGFCLNNQISMQVLQ